MKVQRAAFSPVPPRPRGRPSLAPAVRQLPACTVPAPVHAALEAEAKRRDVSMAALVREALFFHRKNRQTDDGSAS